MHKIQRHTCEEILEVLWDLQEILEVLSKVGTHPHTPPIPSRKDSIFWFWRRRLKNIKKCPRDELDFSGRRCCFFFVLIDYNHHNAYSRSTSGTLPCSSQQLPWPCLLPALLLHLPRKLLHHKGQRSYDDSHHLNSSDTFSLARTACSARLHVQSNCCCAVESSCFDHFASGSRIQGSGRQILAPGIILLDLAGRFCLQEPYSRFWEADFASEKL